MHELLQSQITTPTLYKILLILEAFQFFWYSIHGDFDFLWTVDVSDWLREMVKYLQVIVLREKLIYSLMIYSIENLKVSLSFASISFLESKLSFS